MEFWNTFRNQISTLWNQWSPQQRIGISAATVVCLAAVFGTLVWATRPEYVVIASDLSPQKAIQIVSALENAQITGKTNFGSTSVSVARSDVGDAQLALKDVWAPAAAERGGMMSGFPGTPAEEHDRRVRALEARVARSVEQIRGIASATVHISKPDPSPFAIDKVAPSASVIVEPTSRGALTNHVGQSIVLLVARSVEGLMPENIVLADTAGNQYSAAGGLAGGMSAQFEYQQRLEMNLAQKAESILVSMLGDGKAQVRVTADIDFRETTRTETVFDPDGKVKLKENTETVSHEGGNGIGGVAGYDSQRIEEDPGAIAGGGTYTRETNTTDYDHASTSETIKEAPGKIKRLTVAAIVDLGTTVDDEADAAGGTAVAAVTAEQVESIIKQAVGFDDLRNDEVAVTVAPLNGIPSNPVVPGVMSVYQQYQPLVESVLVGLAATMAFFIAVLAVRRIRPVVVQQGTKERFTREDYQRMAALSEKVQSNPELAARVISTWMGQEDQSNHSEDERPRRTSRAA